ncbi:MAG: hypothetical protein JOY64_21245 [Alphaproteobacteria bacterium]|nr:hypothetical protein [Alphaproteobacteria bacterium]MBV8410168.1 hypothetical protein [Alphaproteobacteria bacterium]
MLSAAEIARGVQGALGFLQRDRTAPMHFENTMEACLRSFQVMLLTLPLYAVYLGIYYAGITYTADETDVVLAEGLRFIVDWLLFPVIFYEIARRRGWLSRYPRYIGALNWINLPATAVAVVGMVLESLVPAIELVLQLGLQALFFYWFLMATRLVLNLNWGLAIALLAVNWLPSLFLLLLVERYVGVVTVTGG